MLGDIMRDIGQICPAFLVTATAEADIDEIFGIGFETLVDKALALLFLIGPRHPYRIRGPYRVLGNLLSSVTDFGGTLTR